MKKTALLVFTLIAAISANASVAHAGPGSCSATNMVLSGLPNYLSSVPTVGCSSGSGNWYIIANPEYQSGSTWLDFDNSNGNSLQAKMPVNSCQTKSGWAAGSQHTIAIRFDGEACLPQDGYETAHKGEPEQNPCAGLTFRDVIDFYDSATNGLIRESIGVTNTC